MTTTGCGSTAALPGARGPLSSTVLQMLQQQPGSVTRPAGGAGADTDIADGDAQLALWLLTEVALSELPGVDADWEWDPVLVGLRTELLDLFESWVRENVAEELTRLSDELALDPVAAVMSAIGRDRSPAVSRWAQRWMSREQFEEYLVLRSPYQLREGDQHSMVIPRLPGPAKVALVEIQYDEYGAGRAERQHSVLFADAMAEAGLDRRLLSHLDRLPATTLLANNFLSLCALRRRLRGAVAGHLGLYEATSCLPSRHWANAARRLGLPAAAEYFDEHVEADAVHEQLALAGMVAALLRSEPDQVDAVALGVAGGIFVDGRATEERYRAWRAGTSALRFTSCPRAA